MSHDPPRKHFLARLIGLVAVAGLAPRWLAQAPATSALSLSHGPAAWVPANAPVAIQPDSRAVARQAGAA